MIGTVEEIVEELQARRDGWGISYCVVHEPYMDALAPVVAGRALLYFRRTREEDWDFGE
jgi:hypothetical protein